MSSVFDTAGVRRMTMRYGFNEIDGWGAFAIGDHRLAIHRRHRLMGTKVIRVFVFDKPVPDPVTEWKWFAAVLASVLEVGAKPMITFAKFTPPFDSERKIRRFVEQCAEIVWSCIESWGPEEVKDWYWCIWNEPNNPDIGGNLSYAHYRRIYEDVARAIFRLLEPHLAGGRAKIGGPSIDGTQRPYWMDWIAQLVTEVDERLLGFVNWHMYGDWRPAAPADQVNVKLWDAPDSPKGEIFKTLLMARTTQYEARARGVAELLRGRGILNVCGELNTIAHHEAAFTLGLNQNAFGAAYYALALIHLIRGGADLELRWSGTSRYPDAADDSYSLMSTDGTPTEACLGKQLFAQHVRCGDWIHFPRPDTAAQDSILAWDGKGRRSAVFVNTSPDARIFKAADFDAGLAECTECLRLDKSTGRRIERGAFDGAVRLQGYGLAVVTNTKDTEID